MGYDLHITRKDCWAEEEDERSISIAEWKAYVESDPDVIKDPENTDENYYLYIRAAGNWPLWFNSHLGNIYTKNPDADVVEKMVKISAALKARVQGDDQEFYDVNGNVYREQEDKLPLNGSKSVNPYERYVRYFYVVAFLASIVWHIFFSDK